jgi:hypothetical protein
VTRIPILAFALAGVGLACGGGQGSDNAPPPTAPQGVSAIAGAQKVTITWTPVSGASSYNLYWSQTSGVTKGTGTKVAGIAASPYVHGHLSPGAFYHVVTASNARGESTESAEVSTAVNLVAFASSAIGHGVLSDWAQAGGNSGPAAADAVCQSLATAASLMGSFRAWLSDSSDDAYCRIHGLTGKKESNCGQATLPVAAGPWVRMDGTAWAGTIDTITNSNYNEDIRVPLLYDETATAWLAQRYVVTGTDASGQVAPSSTCLDWTTNSSAVYGETGSIAAVGAAWTTLHMTICSQDLRLLCLQLGTGPALPAMTPTAAVRKAFVTSTRGSGDLSSWGTDAGGKSGVEAGDSICQSLAGKAGLANSASFKAWLGAAGARPSDRLTSDGPWQRIDGYEIADDKADLSDGSIFTGLIVDESGQSLGIPGSVWTGDWSSSPQPNCLDWTSGLVGQTGQVGSSLETTSWSNYFAFPCNQQLRLYCFEESP